MSGEMSTPAEKLAALNERLKGTALLSLLNIKSKPAPEALAQRVAELREVMSGLCSHLPPDDPIRVTALERMKSVELLVHDPLEWHLLSRALELRQDPSDPALRAVLEAAFYEEHVPRTVWQSTGNDGGQAELRKSLRLPVLIDVELDIAGKRTRCQMHNLSRDGVCLEVPAGFTASQLSMRLHVPSTGAEIAVAGDVVWRDAGRVGVAFKLGVAEQNALDAALQTQFANLSRTVDRWRAIAPKNGNAIACAALVGYAAATLPSSRREHFDRLAAAAHADRGSKDLQLALAKLCIEERDFDGAAQALKRVVVADRADPRYRLLELTLQQRSGRSGGSSMSFRRLLVAARVPLILLATTGLAGAVVFAFVAMRTPFVSASVPIGGLPCTSVKILDANALCFVDAAPYRGLAMRDKAQLADKTLHGLAPRGVELVTVVGANDEVLDLFDAVTLKASLEP